MEIMVITQCIVTIFINYYHNYIPLLPLGITIIRRLCTFERPLASRRGACASRTRVCSSPWATHCRTTPRRAPRQGMPRGFQGGDPSEDHMCYGDDPERWLRAMIILWSYGEPLALAALNGSHNPSNLWELMWWEPLLVSLQEPSLASTKQQQWVASGCLWMLKNIYIWHIHVLLVVISYYK